MHCISLIASGSPSGQKTRNNRVIQRRMAPPNGVTAALGMKERKKEKPGKGCIANSLSVSLPLSDYTGFCSTRSTRSRQRTPRHSAATVSAALVLTNSLLNPVESSLPLYSVFCTPPQGPDCAIHQRPTWCQARGFPFQGPPGPLQVPPPSLSHSLDPIPACHRGARNLRPNLCRPDLDPSISRPPRAHPRIHGT